MEPQLLFLLPVLWTKLSKLITTYLKIQSQFLTNYVFLQHTLNGPALFKNGNPENEAKTQSLDS